MGRSWFQVLAVMIFGSILKYAFINAFVWVFIDLAVFLVCYLLLKRQPFINLKEIMLFLGGLTLVNILVDLGILGAIAGNLALLALIGWMIYGGRFKSNNDKYPPIRKKYHK